jgi:hypothetical protein
MALQDLNRSSDTTGDGLTAIAKPATNKLSDITPKNWRRFPPAAGSMVPTYVPVFTYNGGVPNDINQNGETNVLVDDRGIGDYTPRTQKEKATLIGAVMAVDVTVPEGWISPREPYSAAPAAGLNPTCTSLAPNTGVSGVGKANFPVTVTGTNFTPDSRVLAAGLETATIYVSPTSLLFYAKPSVSVAGTMTVAVYDHGVTSGTQTFTWT